MKLFYIQIKNVNGFIFDAAMQHVKQILLKPTAYPPTNPPTK